MLSSGFTVCTELSRGLRPGDFRADDLTDLCQHGFFETRTENAVGLEDDLAEDAALAITNGGAQKALVGLDGSLDAFVDLEEGDRVRRSGE